MCLSGLTESELTSIRKVLTDSNLAKCGKLIGRNVLWNCEEFVEKVGFYNKSSAYRFAGSMNLISFNLAYQDAVGIDEIEGLPVINPLAEGGSVHPMAHPKVRFMNTWNLLEWLTLARTQQASTLRKALWRVFFSRDNDKACSDVAAAHVQV